jgi:hypothetical protein
MLVSPSHVEAWGEGVSSTSSSFITSAAEPVKLRVLEMQAKYDEIKSDPRFIVYPSGSFVCPQKIRWNRYELDSDYATWSKEVWRPQISRARMNSEHMGMPVFFNFIAIKSVLLTARCRFPLYEHVVVSDVEAKFESQDLINIDQSKAYTRAFENMGSLLSKPGHCIGKLQEAFAVSNREEIARDAGGSRN